MFQNNNYAQNQARAILRALPAAGCRGVHTVWMLPQHRLQPRPNWLTSLSLTLFRRSVLNPHSVDVARCGDGRAACAAASSSSECCATRNSDAEAPAAARAASACSPVRTAPAVRRAACGVRCPPVRLRASRRVYKSRIAHHTEGRYCLQVASASSPSYGSAPLVHAGSQCL